MVFSLFAKLGRHLLVSAESEGESRSVSDFATPWTLYSPWNSPGQNTGAGSCSLLQGIFPNQGSNPGLLHCRQILYQLSHQGRPRILEWVACPFSSRSFQPRNRTRVSCNFRWVFLPAELPGKPILIKMAFSSFFPMT